MSPILYIQMRRARRKRVRKVLQMLIETGVLRPSHIERRNVQASDTNSDSAPSRRLAVVNRKQEQLQTLIRRRREEAKLRSISLFDFGRPKDPR